jgi:hypothetical protein
VLLAQSLAFDVQGLLKQRSRLRVLALSIQIESEVVVALGRVGVFLAQSFAADVQGFLI